MILATDLVYETIKHNDQKTKKKSQKTLQELLLIIQAQVSLTFRMNHSQ